MDAFATALLAVFGVYGILNLVRKICDWLLAKSRSADHVVIYVKGSSESIETTVRTLMLRNPCAEIIVVDEGKSGEMREILDRLCQDCARIHIGRLGE